jgi:hypothetical protein
MVTCILVPEEVRVCVYVCVCVLESVGGCMWVYVSVTYLSDHPLQKVIILACTYRSKSDHPLQKVTLYHLVIFNLGY